MLASYWAWMLAQAAYERGWLAASAQKKAGLLSEAGLHPEQVFIGTGLLSAEQYATLVERLWKIKLERLDIDTYTLKNRAQSAVGVFEAEDEAGERVVLRVDAWARPSVEVSKAPVRHVFFSDVLRWLRQPGVVELSAGEWLEAWNEVGGTELHLGVEHGRGVVQTGMEQRSLDDGCIKREEVPALQAWFEAGFGSRDWGAIREPGIESDWLELVAKHIQHPLTGKQAWEGFLRAPEGVLYVVEPDAWLRRQIAAFDQATHDQRLFQERKTWHTSPVAAEERERVVHGVLAGASLCWVDDTGSSFGCVRQIAGAGIPVTVVRARSTVHGTAWEVYRLSV